MADIQTFLWLHKFDVCLLSTDFSILIMLYKCIEWMSQNEAGICYKSVTDTLHQVQKNNLQKIIVIYYWDLNYLSIFHFLVKNLKKKC